MASFPNFAALSEEVMKKLTIDWDVIGQIECSGTARLDEWADDQTFMDVPTRSTTVQVLVSQNSTSMKNFSKAIFTDEISGRLKEMMKHFFSGVKQDDHTWEWIDLGKD
jgi:hypothetical protein